jgi:aspartyl-tRNA(Asn)/glutamyl-tRNA(Gln) amidotransferase subunit A
MEKPMNFTKMGIKSLRKALDSKAVSAEELALEYLARIESSDPVIGAFITVTKEQAIADAKSTQAVIDAGNAAPLTGIPAAVKDNLCTKDIKTTCASNMLADFTPPYDATAVEKLKTAGYVLLGKTNMDEFAMGGSTQTSAFAKTKNPRDITCVPGGSSGGSAAAVAAGMCAYALGSDTGGSIRQPSAFCGVTGLKPTYGRVSRYGLIAFGSSLDQIGPIANSAYDCALILNQICGKDSKDATSISQPVTDFTQNLDGNIHGMRVALPAEFFGEGISDVVKSAVESAAKLLEQMGAVLIPCSMKTLPFAVSSYYLLSSAEAASNLARFDGVKCGLRGNGATYEDRVKDSRNRGFGEEVKRRILLGNYALSSGYYDAYYRKAQALRQQIRAEYADIFAQADVILTPTTPDVAYKIGSQEDDPVKMYAADICTVTANIAGLPSVSTPCGNAKNGLPIGMAFTGRAFDEAGILKAADAFERERDEDRND